MLDARLQTIYMTDKHGTWLGCEYCLACLKTTVVLTMFLGSHLMLTESMLSVYKQAEGIKPEDEAAFAFYALLTVGAVHHHHAIEEKQYCALAPP
jgi:hypothetical protein